MTIQQQKQFKILVIGETCLDVYVYGEVNRICPEAPVPVFNTVRENKSLGMAGNVSKNLAALKVEHEFITNKNFEDVKKVRFVHDKFNSMLLRVDENDKIKRFEKLNEINFSAYDAVLVSDYDKGFLTKEDIQKITQLNPRVFLDTKKVLGEWCENAFLIKINEKEYKKSKDRVNRILSKKIVCTLGSRGCAYRGKIYPVEKVDIMDVSGAGDTFLAGLVSMYIQSLDVESSIIFANKCATYVVQKRGVATVDSEFMGEDKSEV